MIARTITTIFEVDLTSLVDVGHYGLYISREDFIEVFGKTVGEYEYNIHLWRTQGLDIQPRSQFENLMWD